MSADLTTVIKAAETARCAAMLVNDNVALAALLDPRLQFHHATGAVDDKDAYMAKMAAGRIQYVGINWSEELVIALGESAAVLTGRMNTDVRVEGVGKALINRVAAVWSLNDGAWQMLVFQSTPIAV
ncbi:MAG: nuclear transport factor 2 family protein [Sphingorhabdus sp.]|nr:nuclear transport factor 2 family protein [Sphingorhabdus sp.]